MVTSGGETWKLTPPEATLERAAARRGDVAPRWRWRGLMLSLRSGPADPSLCRELIDTLAAHGGNVLQLEIEKAVRYDSHPEVSAEWAMSKKDLRALVQHAKELGLTAMPLLPTLGHVVYITQAHPEILESSRTIDVYCPSNDASYRICCDLIDELLEIFEPEVFHITHDEVVTHYDLTRRMPVFVCPRCRTRTAAELFAEDVGRYREYLQERGCRTMIWADGLLDPGRFQGQGCALEGNAFGGPPDNLHEAVDLLPRDVLMQVWNYQPQTTYPHVNHLLDKGFEVVASPSHGPNVYLTAVYLTGVEHANLLGMIQTVWSRILREPPAALQRSVWLGALCAWDPAILQDLDDEWVAACEARRQRRSPLLGLGAGRHDVTLEVSDALPFSEGYVGKDVGSGLLAKGGRFYSVAFLVRTARECLLRDVRVRFTGSGQPAVDVEVNGGRQVAAVGLAAGVELDLTPFCAGSSAFKIRLSGRNAGDSPEVMLDRLRFVCDVATD